MQHDYEEPKVVDFGDLQELTAFNATNPVTDVPIGSGQQPNEGVS